MSVELSETFYISNKRRHIKIHVKLNAEGICLARENEQGKIDENRTKLEDIIGSRCGRRLKRRARGSLSSCKRLSNDEEEEEEQKEKEHPNSDERADGVGLLKDNSAYLYIYAYIKKENPLRRVRTVHILRFRSQERYEENLKSAECWHQALTTLNKRSGAARESGAEQEEAIVEPVDGREFLILLNPKSGSCKGREIFQKQVVPVLHEARIPYELHVTKYTNFAREFVRSKKDLLQRYCGIIVAAGDGIFYEVLNGLMERVDWQLASRHLPIGIIPCGSGNGLARSIAYLYDEPFEPKPILYATLTCVSGHSAPMDVVRVEIDKNGKRTKMYSFLSVGWGLIADIDIESERLRSLGAQRFTLWSIRRLINLRTYKGKVYFLPCQQKQHELQQLISSSKFDSPGASEEFHDLSDISEEEEQMDDEFVDVISLNSYSLGPRIGSGRSATSHQTTFFSIADQSMRSHCSMTGKIEAAAAAYVAQKPASTIPAPNMPLPMDIWRCIEGEFVMVHAGYTTHLTTDCLLAPASRLNDGIIYLVIIRAGVRRSQLAQFLLNLSSGNHLPEQPDEYIQIFPVTAFRIEPKSSNVDGIITVDGERVDYGVIQGEMVSGLVQVMVPKNASGMAG